MKKSKPSRPGASKPTAPVAKSEPVKTAKPAPAPVAAPAPAPTGTGFDFLAWVAKRDLAVLMGAVVLACFFVFRDFISFEKVYLFKDIGSDSINYTFPGLVQMSDYIKTYGVPTWTFSQGLGQNIFPFWMSDFFSLVAMMFKREQLPYTLAYIEIAKVLLSSFVFYKYLGVLKLSKMAVCVGAFSFAFCGYIILGGCWSLFSNEALYVSILLYGFERWLNRGKILWLVLGVTGLSLLQPFLLFPYTLFLAGYIPVRYNDVRPDGWKQFPLFLAKTVGLAVVGVAISSYQLFPDLLQYIESPRVGGEAGLTARLKAQPMFQFADDVLRFTTTFRAFSSDMLGSGSGFQGWQNYLEAPLFYCGNLCLVLFPQMFPGLNKRQRIAYGILGGVFFIPVIFPYFRYIFWAFTGDYFRTYSFVITFLLLLFAVKGLDQVLKSKKVNLVVLGVTVVALLALLYTPNEQYAAAINAGLRSFATLLIVVYAGLLVGITRKDLFRFSAISLVVVVFFELVYFSSQTINEREVVTGADLREKIGFNDYTLDAVAYLKQHDKNFFRVNKDYASGVAIHQSINDAKAQGYFGSASYNSFNQTNYIRFLGSVGVLDPKNEMATRWAMGVNSRPILFSMVSGKYWLVKKPDTHPENFGYRQMAKFGDVAVWENMFYLPFGFVYDTVLEESSFAQMSNFQKDQYLIRGCVVSNDDKDLLSAGPHFSISDTLIPFSLPQYAQYISVLRKDTLTVTSFRENHISGTINQTHPGILFFSIPFDQGWKGYVNGKDATLYRINNGFIGMKLAEGKNDVELKFEPRLAKTGGMVSLAGIALLAGLLFLTSRQTRPQEEGVA